MKTAYFTKEEEAAIVAAIQQAESHTSGEIRVHVEKTCKIDPYEKAAFWFQRLKMHKTKHRNGVLVYVAVESHKVAVLGDVGINAVVPEEFWQSTLNVLLDEFKQGHMAEGIAKAVLEAGNQLKKYFPAEDGDENELSDDISYA